MNSLNELLDETERLCAAATPGPWGVHVVRGGVPGSDVVEVISRRVDGPDGRSLNNKGVEPELYSAEDADLIAHARSALPKLVEELRKERREHNECIDDLGRLGAVLRDICLAFEAGDDAKARQIALKEWNETRSNDQDAFGLMHDSVHRDPGRGRPANTAPRKSMPRVWMGERTPTGKSYVAQWFPELEGWVPVAELLPGAIFVAESETPAPGPREMKSLATCSEVDW